MNSKVYRINKRKTCEGNEKLYSNLERVPLERPSHRWNINITDDGEAGLQRAYSRQGPETGFCELGIKTLASMQTVNLFISCASALSWLLHQFIRLDVVISILQIILTN
jgi:hypothetical protein